MNWMLIAVIGHLGNAVAFIVDKILLTTAFKRSATYAGLIGLMSSAAIVLWPWVNRWPSGNMVLVGAMSGGAFVFALWLFFAALARSEASRVVPIVGSLIPVLTLVGTTAFLGERLTIRQLTGFALLVLATVILSSSGGKARPTREAVLFAVSSAALFAFATVTAKAVYDNGGFLSGIVISRLAAAATTIVILTLFDRQAGNEIQRLITAGVDQPSSNQRPRLKLHHAAILALIGQAGGSLGFIMVQYATAQGSAALVNALQAVQYAILVIAGFLLHRHAPGLLGERVEKAAIAIKICALIITAVGLALVS